MGTETSDTPEQDMMTKLQGELHMLLARNQDQEAELSTLRTNLQQEKDRRKDSNHRSDDDTADVIELIGDVMCACRLSQVIFTCQMQQECIQEKEALLVTNSTEKDQLVKQLASTKHQILLAEENRQQTDQQLEPTKVPNHAAMTDLRREMDMLRANNQDQESELSKMRVDLQKERDKHMETNDRSTVTLDTNAISVLTGYAYRLSQNLAACQSQQQETHSTEKTQLAKQLASTEEKMSNLHVDLEELTSALSASKVKHVLCNNLCKSFSYSISL